MYSYYDLFWICLCKIDIDNRDNCIPLSSSGRQPKLDKDNVIINGSVNKQNPMQTHIARKESQILWFDVQAINRPTSTAWNGVKFILISYEYFFIKKVCF